MEYDGGEVKQMINVYAHREYTARRQPPVPVKMTELLNHCEPVDQRIELVLKNLRISANLECNLSFNSS